jgi:hypothetical protein
MSIKIDGSAFRAGGRPRSAVGEYAMKPHIFSFIGAFALAGLLGSAQSLAQNAYITNLGSNSWPFFITKCCRGALGRVNGRLLVIRGRSGSHWNCIADFDGICLILA